MVGQSCTLCSDRAEFKDKNVIRSRDGQRFLYYCKGCVGMGVKFGFLEKDDMVRL